MNFKDINFTIVLSLIGIIMAFSVGTYFGKKPENPEVRQGICYEGFEYAIIELDSVTLEHLKSKHVSYALIKNLKVFIPRLTQDGSKYKCKGGDYEL